MLRRVLLGNFCTQRLSAVRKYSSKFDDDFEKLTQQLLTPNSVSDNKKPVHEWDSLDSVEEDGEDGESDTPSFDASVAPVQKEELIFKEVLGQVLSNNKRTPKNEATTQPLNRNAALSDSILALFDKPEPSHNKGTSESSGKSSPSIASLMDGLLQGPETVSLTPEEAARQERTRRRVAPVLLHIDSLPTNVDVVGYFEDVIIPRFIPSISENSDLDTPLDPLNPQVVPGTVSHLLEKCISSLLNDFSDPLGALHLFETTKHHSIELFTEACSAEVYNLIIRLRWEEYRDLYSVVSLASEIAINAIQPNLETTELLSKIYRDAMDSSKGVSSSALGMPLWSGQDLRRLDELNRYRTRFQSSWASKPILRI